MSTEQTTQRHVAVYCGARNGADPAFIETASAVGSGIASAGYHLVFGGGKDGLMGATAQGALDAGGHVIGVQPQALMDIEFAHPDIQELHITDNMHVRKAKMHGLADAFVILPGGIGTLDEFFEAITWNQLKIHATPIVIVNINGIWDGLLELLNSLRDAGLMPESTLRWVHEVTTADEAIQKLNALLQA